jgi:hypothetical protein
VIAFRWWYPGARGSQGWLLPGVRHHWRVVRRSQAGGLHLFDLVSLLCSAFLRQNLFNLSVPKLMYYGPSGWCIMRLHAPVCNIKIFVWICVVELCCDINLESPFVIVHDACMISARFRAGASQAHSITRGISPSKIDVLWWTNYSWAVIKLQYLWLWLFMA